MINALHDQWRIRFWLTFNGLGWVDEYRKILLGLVLMINDQRKLLLWLTVTNFDNTKRMFCMFGRRTYTVQKVIKISAL